MDRQIPVPIRMFPFYTMSPLEYTDKNKFNMRLNEIINTIKTNDIDNTDILIDKIYSDTIHPKLSLLIEASIIGEVSIVKILIDRYHAAVDNLGDVVYFHSLIKGVTALWCAAANGNIEVVQILLDNGADINHISEPSTNTLLHGVDTADLTNTTCLMVACNGGKKNVMNLLIENGADINLQNNVGASALHFVAENGDMCLIEEILKKNPLQLNNKLGLTPLLIAADKANYKMTVLMWKGLGLSLEDKIEAKELLGASLLNIEYHIKHDRGRPMVLSAQRKREQNPELRKKVIKPVECYNTTVIFQNLGELLMKFDSTKALHLDGLIIKERILGETHEKLIHTIVSVGHTFEFKSDFKSCLLLWNHALQLSIHNKVQIEGQLRRIILNFSAMLIHEPSYELSILKNTLLLTCDELIRIKRSLPDKADETYEMISEYFDIIMLYTLILIYEASKVLSTLLIEDPEVVPELMKIIVKIIKNDFRTSEGQTLLHLSLIYNENRIGSEYNYFSFETMKLLIFCGADVNAVDNVKNTPLHCIGGYIKTDDFVRHDVDKSKTKNRVMELLNAGAHTDYVNALGDCPHTGYLSDLFNLTNDVPRQLKCLSASVLRQQFPEEYYSDKLPTELIKFINLH